MYRILIADDEAGIRQLIKKYAEFEGHEVFEAADGYGGGAALPQQGVRHCDPRRDDA